MEHGQRTACTRSLFAASAGTLGAPRARPRPQAHGLAHAPPAVGQTLINVPAALIVLGLVFSIDDLTGFEITKARARGCAGGACGALLTRESPAAWRA